MSDETTSKPERESAQHPYSLRVLADVLEQAQLPGSVHAGINGSGRMTITVFTYDVEEMREARRKVGTVEKREGFDGMYLAGDLGGVPVSIHPPPGTCERVQVGTEKRRITETVETDEFEEVPVYEWDCPPVLIDEPEAVSA